MKNTFKFKFITLCLAGAAIAPPPFTPQEVAAKLRAATGRGTVASVAARVVQNQQQERANAAAAAAAQLDQSPNAAQFGMQPSRQFAQAAQSQPASASARPAAASAQPVVDPLDDIMNAASRPIFGAPAAATAAPVAPVLDQQAQLQALQDKLIAQEQQLRVQQQQFEDHKRREEVRLMSLQAKLQQQIAEHKDEKARTLAHARDMQRVIEARSEEVNAEMKVRIDIINESNAAIAALNDRLGAIQREFAGYDELYQALLGERIENAKLRQDIVTAGRSVPLRDEFDNLRQRLVDADARLEREHEELERVHDQFDASQRSCAFLVDILNRLDASAVDVAVADSARYSSLAEICLQLGLPVYDSQRFGKKQAAPSGQALVAASQPSAAPALVAASQPAQATATPAPAQSVALFDANGVVNPLVLSRLMIDYSNNRDVMEVLRLAGSGSQLTSDQRNILMANGIIK